MLSMLGMTAASFTDWDMPQQRLDGFFEQSKISALDLLPVFRAEREPMYAADNTHWNVQGSALAARSIAAWLEPDLTTK
jgi:hypothetical protein